MSAPVDVLAVMERAAEAARNFPQDGQHYAAALNDGTHAVMRMRMCGLGNRARSGEQVDSRPTKEEAEAECDRLNGFAEARAAVAELIAATQRTRAGLPVLHGLILGTFGEESGGARKAEMFMRELDAALALVGAA